jgi:Ca2+-binding RTX toxin-like protein
MAIVTNVTNYSSDGSSTGDSITGTEWADTLSGGLGNDTISGLGGNDNLSGRDGNDILDGDAGDDFLYVGSGSDTVIGGAGKDTVSYESSSTGVALTLVGGVGRAVHGTSTDSVSGIENVLGSSFGDSIALGDSDTTGAYVFGFGGNDVLTSGASYQNFIGGSGADTIDGGVGPGGDQVSYAYTYNDLAVTGRGVIVDLAAGTAIDNWGSQDVLRNIENIEGSQYDDSLAGDSNTNYINGGAGADTIDGGAGNDQVNYYFIAGDHTGYLPVTGRGVSVNLAAGTATDNWGNQDVLRNIEQVSGSQYDDSLVGDSNNNSIYGGSGADTLDGGAGDDWLKGDSGNDLINGGAGNDRVGYDGNGLSGVSVSLINGSGVVTGGLGTDTLTSIENITGSYFDDVISIGDTSIGGSIEGRAGNDILTGGNGNNYITGGSGGDTIDGGVGIDTANYSSETYDNAGPLLVTGRGVVVNLTAGLATDNWGNQDVLRNIEQVIGSQYDDSMVGDINNNSLFGGLGNDAISGLSGNDNLTGQEGNDSLDGGEGDDFLIGGAGNDTIIGGGGKDTASFTGAASGVSLSLVNGSGVATGGDGTDSLIGIEGIQGSYFSDFISLGDSDSNGGSIFGNGGNDTLVGGAGFQNLYGGSGDDSIDGGAGNDQVNYSQEVYDNNGSVFLTGRGVTVNLVAGTATDNWGNLDVLRNIEHISGSQYDDSLVGDGNDNSLYGGSGADIVNGGAGRDNLNGDAGNDTINGGEGNDWLDGGSGNDSLLGGASGDNLFGGLGDDLIDGGLVLDTIQYMDVNTANYSNAIAGVNVNLQTGLTTGGDGNDTLISINAAQGSKFNDTLIGDASLGYVNFTGGVGDDYIDGGLILDRIAGRDFHRVTYTDATSSVKVNLGLGVSYGGAGNDTLLNINQIRGSNSADVLVGSDNWFIETFEGGAGNDTIDGGTGDNWARYRASTAAVNVNLKTGIALDGYGTVDTLFNINGARGSAFDDTLVGGNAAYGTGTADGLEIFLGEAGSDLMDGGQGFDRVTYGGSLIGVDVNLGGFSAGVAQDGWGGVDTLVSIEMVVGSRFDDTLAGSSDLFVEVFEGNEGSDLIDGGAITDLINFSNSNQVIYSGTLDTGVNVNLTTGLVTGGAGNDTLTNINVVRGSTFADTLQGSTALVFEGFEGDGGDDLIDGGAITDIYNQANNNRASYSKADGAVSVNLATGLATGADGNDTLSNINQVRGSGFDDTIVGSNSSLIETFEGLAGRDLIDGAAGIDICELFQSRMLR